MSAPVAPPTQIAARLRGTPLVLLLDVDGTLCDIVEHADEARVPEETQRLLTRLAARPDVCIAIVTGRSGADARRMVGIGGIPIAANHGIERIGADGTEQIAPGWERAARSVRAAVADLERVPLDFAGAFVEDKQFTLSVHYRQLDNRRHAALYDVVSEVAARHALRVAGGKAVINILPNMGMNKGDAVLTLVRELHGDADGASILYAGDDVTDEDAFTALARHVPGAITVRVGTDDVPTAAELRVATPRDLVDVLTLVERDRR